MVASSRSRMASVHARQNCRSPPQQGRGRSSYSSLHGLALCWAAIYSRSLPSPWNASRSSTQSIPYPWTARETGPPPPPRGSWRTHAGPRRRKTPTLSLGSRRDTRPGDQRQRQGEPSVGHSSRSCRFSHSAPIGPSGWLAWRSTVSASSAVRTSPASIAPDQGEVEQPLGLGAHRFRRSRPPRAAGRGRGIRAGARRAAPRGRRRARRSRHVMAHPGGAVSILWPCSRARPAAVPQPRRAPGRAPPREGARARSGRRRPRQVAKAVTDKRPSPVGPADQGGDHAAPGAAAAVLERLTRAGDPGGAATSRL